MWRSDILIERPFSVTIGLQHWDIAFDSDVHTADIRASMDKATNILTLTAKRYRRYIPIEYQVQTKPISIPRPRQEGLAAFR